MRGCNCRTPARSPSHYHEELTPLPFNLNAGDILVNTYAVNVAPFPGNRTDQAKVSHDANVLIAVSIAAIGWHNYTCNERISVRVVYHTFVARIGCCRCWKEAIWDWTPMPLSLHWGQDSGSRNGGFRRFLDRRLTAFTQPLCRIRMRSWKSVYTTSRPDRRVAAAGASRGPTRPAVPARHGHLDPGDQPPLEDLRQDHQPGRSQSAHAAGHPRQLPGAVPPRRGDSPVRHGADEPACTAPANRPITSSTAPGARRPREEAKTQARSTSPGTARRQLQPHPKQNESKLDPNAAYAYICSNETIQGVQYPKSPTWATCPGLRLLVRLPLPADSDRRSTASSSPVPRRTLGPAGVTVVIIRDDLVALLARQSALAAQLQGVGRGQVAA